VSGVTDEPVSDNENTTPARGLPSAVLGVFASEVMTSPVEVQSPAECPHGLRPGTTVCLRCRQEARSAARAKRVRMATRAGLAGMAAVVAIALIVGAWNAIATDGADTSAPVIAQVSASGAVDAAAPARPAARPTARENPTPALEPAMPEGRKDLGDSIYAVREGAQVTVFFDTDSLRTRFDWKFEGVVRATLPIVFGDEIRAGLDSIPAGSLATGGSLVYDLPARGIPIRVGSRTLRVWPVTREGRDGPLVMAYRASATR
jgi:hypothetical protein